MSALRNGGEAMVDALVAHDVDTVFGIPGIQLDPLYDALHARRNRIRLVHTRHEQGAAFMAMGYAQASGRTGVFAVVPGPGLLNAMAAVSTAVAANAPVFGITGQIPSDQIGLGLGIAHELRDQLAMSRGVVEWAERANHPQEIPRRVAEAFAHMHSGRGRPAIIEVAPDQFYAKAPVVPVAPFEVARGPAIDSRAVDAMARALEGAVAPALFVGGGALDAQGPLTALAERLQAPVFASQNGRGAMSDRHPLSFDLLSAQEVWAEIDVALAIGTRFLAPAMAWGREGEVKVLRIDVDPLQIARPAPPDVALIADAAPALEALLEVLGSGTPPREGYLARVDDARAQMRLKLDEIGCMPALANGLRAAIADDAIVVCDVTQLGAYLRHAAPVYAPRTLLGPGYQATLGYALPAALGAKLARPERQVVAVCGDGGFMFTVQELASAVHHRIPIVCIVLDNQAYGNVKTIQDERFGGRHIGVDLSNPDFVAMAKAFGMRAERVDEVDALQPALERALALDEPVLLHVPVDQVPSIWGLIKRPPSQGRVG